MAKHANIPHEIVWSLRRSMESALRMMDELEEVLKDLGPNPDPTNLESKVEEQLAQLANVRPELEILANIFEELVHQYVDSYVMRKNCTMTSYWTKLPGTSGTCRMLLHDSSISKRESCLNKRTDEKAKKAQKEKTFSPHKVRGSFLS